MFFEIEMYKDFIDGLVNLLETVENKDNVTIDLCFNMSEEIEKIDYDKISKIASKYNIILIEDAAQSFGATYKAYYCHSFINKSIHF